MSIGIHLNLRILRIKSIFFYWTNKLNKREEKESDNRAIRRDGKQFLKKIAQSDTL